MALVISLLAIAVSCGAGTPDASTPDNPHEVIGEQFGVEIIELEGPVEAPSNSPLLNIRWTRFGFEAPCDEVNRLSCVDQLIEDSGDQWQQAGADQTTRRYRRVDERSGVECSWIFQSAEAGDRDQELRLIGLASRLARTPNAVAVWVECPLG